MTDHTTRTLAERIAEDYAAAWRPEPGDSLIGFLTEIAVGTSDYGDYPILTLTTANGDRASVHAFHTVLKDGLIDAQPSIGEELAIKYNGLRLPKGLDEKTAPKVGSKDDPRYHDYRVIINRAPEDVWGKFGKSAPRDA